MDIPGGKADTVTTPEFETPAKRVTRVNVTSNSGAIQAQVVDSSPNRPTQILLYALPEGATCKDEIGAQGQTELTPVAESTIVANPDVEYVSPPGPTPFCIVIDNANNVPISMALAINTDLPEEPEEPECEEPEPVMCGPAHTPCDDVDDGDYAHAIGLNCGDEVAQVAYSGHIDAVRLQAGAIGTSGTYDVREGERMLVLSTGRAADLLVPGSPASDNGTSFGGGPDELPAPMTPLAVSEEGVTCTDDPSLVGWGDCSNALQAQMAQGEKIHDYAEVRIKATVPDYASALSFDFAMFSAEYPTFYHTSFNDMFVGWLESESWTGNISFDEQGNPMSLNAGFWNYKDAPNEIDCPEPCVAPELAGTAMEGHAGTKWLTTSAPVVAGEQIELILAVFDLSDGLFDTAVLIDNFDWTCAEGPPSTCATE